MRKVLYLWGLLFCCLPGFGQHSDCDFALEIKTNGPHHLKTKGAGKLKEIFSPNTKDLHWFEKEHNIVWVKFQMPETKILTFSITPANGKDDVDFLLFQYREDGFCDGLPLKKEKPLRSNLARSEGPTGLSRDGTSAFTPSGPGNPMALVLEVKKDEVFYLAIDNVTGANEVVLYIDLKTPTEIITTDAAPLALPEPKEIKTPFLVRVYDAKTGKPVNGNFDIPGYQIGEPFKISDTTQFTLELSSSQMITLNVNAPGYIFYSHAMMAPQIPFDAKRMPDTVKFDVNLKPIVPGEVFKIPNIKFVGDETAFLPVSRPGLLALYRFMNRNPGAQIEIVGHVNAPDMKNIRQLKKLSQERAEAVKKYLVEKGIESNRISCTGAGNSQMKYRKPMTEMQNEENRRVEIIIKKI
jgi:outer membrane protein OmpA-like peptidoglycan-associated protein